MISASKNNQWQSYSISKHQSIGNILGSATKPVLEYSCEISRHLAQIESNDPINPFLIDQQPEIDWSIRPFLLDYLIELHLCFGLEQRTLYLACYLTDAYLSKRIVYRKHYQLLITTSLWIASKYEDKKNRVPLLSELSRMCRGIYEENLFLEMEKNLLMTMNWSLAHTSVEEIIQMIFQQCPAFPKVSKDTMGSITETSMFLAQLTMYDRAYMFYPVSVRAITCALLACNIHNVFALCEVLRPSVVVDGWSGSGTSDENAPPRMPFFLSLGDHSLKQVRKCTLLLVEDVSRASYPGLLKKYATSHVPSLVEKYMGQHSAVYNLEFERALLHDSYIPQEIEYMIDYLLGWDYDNDMSEKNQSSDFGNEDAGLLSTSPTDPFFPSKRFIPSDY